MLIRTMTLQLVCSVNDPQARALFLDRWHRSLERAWSNIWMDPRESMIERVNHEIQKHCEPMIESDIGEQLLRVTSLDDKWVPAPHGRSLGVAPIMAATASGPKPWTLQYAGSPEPAGICIHVEWDLRNTEKDL